MSGCFLSALLLLSAILVCFVPVLHASEALDNAAIMANLTAVDLAVYTDPVTFLPMSDVVLAYRLVDPTVTFTATMGSVTANLAALRAQSIDFAMSATTTTHSHTHALALTARTWNTICLTSLPSTYGVFASNQFSGRGIG